MTKTRKARIMFPLLLLVCIAMSVCFFVACGEDDIPAIPTSIEVETTGIKTDYVAGQTLDLSGLKIKLVYGKDANAERKEISLSELETVPANGATLTVGNSSVTVRYNKDGIKLSKSFKISVHNNITGVTQKTGSALKNDRYFIGETISPAGITYMVAREDGSVEEVAATADNTIIDPPTFVAGTTKATFKYKDYDTASFEYDVQAVNGVFIEAEDGILPVGAVLCTDGLDGDEAHRPSGTGYVGDFKADDTKDLRMTFVFSSDVAGVGDVQFRMASQYLKKDSNWTPIWMGDVQLNKICDVYVNDTLISVPDTAILAGGGSEDGEPDGSLWLNWQTVELKGVNMIAGKNTVQLKFKEHDYKDCSQPAFNGKFTANIDSLIVTSQDCTITPYDLAFDAESLKPTGVSLERIADEDGAEKPYFVLTGTVYYTGYSEEEAAHVMVNALNKTVKGNNANQYTFSGFRYDFQGNLAAGATAKTTPPYTIAFTSEPSDRDGAGATDYKGTFTVKYDISSLTLADGLGKYATHFGASAAGNLNFIEGEGEHKKDDLDVSMVSTESIKIGYNTYALVYEPWYDKTLGDTEYNADADARKEHYYGTVGLRISSKCEAETTVTGVTLEQGTEDNADKLYLAISGTAAVVDYSEVDAAEAIADSLSFTTGVPVNAIVTKTADGEDGAYTATFTVTVEVTGLMLGDYPITLGGKEIVNIDGLDTAEKTFGKNTYRLVETEKTIPPETEGGEETVVKVVSFKKDSAYKVTVTKTDIFSAASGTTWTVADVDGKAIVTIEGALAYTKSDAFTDSEEDVAYLNTVLTQAIAARFTNVRIENHGNVSSIEGWNKFADVTCEFVVVSDARFALKLDVTSLGTKAGVVGMIKMGCPDNPNANGDYKPQSNGGTAVAVVGEIGYKVFVGPNSTHWSLLDVQTITKEDAEALLTAKSNTTATNSATLVEEEGSVYVVVTGTSKNYTDSEEDKTALLTEILSNNGTPRADVEPGEGSEGTKADLIEKTALTFNAEDGTYTVKIDVTEVAIGYYWMHLGAADVTNPGENPSVTLNGKTYHFEGYKYSWGTGNNLVVTAAVDPTPDTPNPTPDTPEE